MSLTRVQRDALPNSDFAVPDRRLLPIHDAKHVAMARIQIIHAKGLNDEDRAAAQIRIQERADEFDMEFGGGGTLASLSIEAAGFDLTGNDNHPNRMPFSGVLVKLDQASDSAPHGSNGKKIRMRAAAAQAALATLIGMGVNITVNRDNHDQQNKIGIITAATIEGSDVRIGGFIYAADFPGEATYIRANKDSLGFSFEAQDIHVASLDADVLDITACVFTGAAILRKDKAAFTTTSLAASAAGEIDMTKEDMQAMLDATVAPIVQKIAAIEASQVSIDEKIAAATKPAPTAEEIGAATAVLEAAGLKLAAKAEPAPDPAIAALTAQVADLGTKLADAIAAKRDAVEEPVRKTLSPQITSLLARAGITTPEGDGKMKVADVDKMLAAGNHPIGERIRIKQEMSRAGVLEDAA